MMLVVTIPHKEVDGIVTGILLFSNILKTITGKVKSTYLATPVLEDLQGRWSSFIWVLISNCSCHIGF